MKNSDTPRTDECYDRLRRDYRSGDATDLHLMAEFARQLERDFNDAMSGAEKLYKKLKATRPEARRVVGRYDDSNRLEWVCERLSAHSMYIQRHVSGFALYTNSALLGYGETIADAIDHAMKAEETPSPPRRKLQELCPDAQHCASGCEAGNCKRGLDFDWP